ncbi:MAG: hypothetical protein K8D98_01600, partial [Rhodanobacter sp.]|nr:hypothetical protein [Rhodanobacter sp.]
TSFALVFAVPTASLSPAVSLPAKRLPKSTVHDGRPMTRRSLRAPALHDPVVALPVPATTGTDP